MVSGGTSQGSEVDTLSSSTPLPLLLPPMLLLLVPTLDTSRKPRSFSSSELSWMMSTCYCGEGLCGQALAGWEKKACAWAEQRGEKRREWKEGRKTEEEKRWGAAGGGKVNAPAEENVLWAAALREDPAHIRDDMQPFKWNVPCGGGTGETGVRMHWCSPTTP